MSKSLCIFVFFNFYVFSLQAYNEEIRHLDPESNLCGSNLRESTQLNVNMPENNKVWFTQSNIEEINRTDGQGLVILNLDIDTATLETLTQSGMPKSSKMNISHPLYTKLLEVTTELQKKLSHLNGKKLAFSRGSDPEPNYVPLMYRAPQFLDFHTEEQLDWDITIIVAATNHPHTLFFYNEATQEDIERISEEYKIIVDTIKNKLEEQQVNFMQL
ncbi:MAG: hypothetical protein KDD40_01895 [Bdellovibrionales bacterium]|nr:hypothetical protein [Bdellovibrionales bacterium]